MRLISVVRGVSLRPRAIIVAALIVISALSVSADPIAIPTPTEQAVQYHNFSNLVWGINQILALLLLPLSMLVLGTRTRIAAKLRSGKYFTFVILAIILFTLNRLVQLPLDRLRTSSLNQIRNEIDLPILQWISSQFMQALPAIVVSVSAALLAYWLINRSPVKWWIWASGVFSGLLLVFLVVEPFTISHKPLGQSPAEVRLSEFAAKIGIPTTAIVSEDCEPFSSCEIAHVSGLGPTRLILLNKGLFDAYPESWARQSFAHESKHYLNDDNLVGWIVLTVISLVFLFLVDRLSRVTIRRFPERLGFTSIAQPAALPLLVLVLNVIYLTALPPINIFRQHVEFAADRHGLELTSQNHVLAEMVSSWTTESKYRVPGPSRFFMIFRSSHPSDAERITYANEFGLKDKKE
ncbi:MAG: M48 family metalloprotease [Chloracidobacterium sp.]|nr:M48 family metalloprotease [Chloracidobacterium sp.]